MATEIDNKVVSMRFDNSQFEQNVQKSIATLQRLKDSLNLDSSAKSLTNLENKMSDLDVSGVNRAAQSASKAFSSFGVVGFSVINRLTNSVMNLGRSITANLTRPIREGMQTYEQQIKATQTTMNALNLKGKEGEAKVRYYLKDLNKYSDETIYRFSDMTTSLSKFVSAGVNINDATKAIKGLSNVAALSGADTAQFSRAIYNISQSLGMGKMITRDWMSIENANMATKEFKETLIQTAQQMGYIDKQGKLTQKGLSGVSRTQLKSMKEMTITYKNFRDSLSGGWLKNDVLIGALKRYADETDTLGKKGKAAATEVKTFSQLMDTLGDSLATKWANIYTNVVGNFNEAKSFWTRVSNVLDRILVKPLDRLDKVTSKWKELGGRDTVLRSMSMQLNGFRTALSSMKAAWEMVFPKGTQLKILQAVTKAFQNFSYVLSGFLIKSAMPLSHIMLGLASAIKIALRIAQTAGQILAPIVKLIGQVVLAILKILGSIGDLIFGISNLNTKLTPFQIVAKGVAKVCELLGKAVNFVADAFTRLTHLSFGWPKGTETAVKKAEETQKKVNPFIKFFQAIGGFLVRIAKVIGGAVAQVFGGLAKGFGSLNDKLDDSSLTPIEKIYTIINMIFSGAMMVNVLKGMSLFNKGFKSFGDIVSDVKGKIGNFGKAIKDFFKPVDTSTFTDSIKKLSKALTKDVNSFANKRNAEALKSFAVAVAILAGSLVLVSSINPDRLLTAVAAIAALAGMLAGVMALMTKLTKVGKGFNNLVALFAPNQQQQVAKAMIMVSIAVAILAASLTVLGQLDVKQLIKGEAAIAGLMLLLVGITEYMQHGSKGAKKGFIGAAISLNLVAMAVGNLTKSLIMLASIPIKQLIQGGAALTGIVVLLAAISKWLGKDKGLGVMASMGIINLAMAVNMLVKPIQQFGAMKVGDIVKGLITLGLSLAAITITLKAVSKNAGMIFVFGLALTAMAPGLIGFAAALRVISSIDTGSLVASVAAIGSLFAMLSIVGYIMAKNKVMMGTIPVLAASFLLLAPAVMTLAAAFLIFSKCNWTGVLGGIVAISSIAATMTIIGTAMAANKWLMLTMPIFAASMLILAPAIVTLSAAFAVFSQCDWGGILGGVVAIAGIATIMTLVGTVMSKNKWLMLTMPLFAAYMNLLAPAIVTLSAAFAVFSQCNWTGVIGGIVAIAGLAAVFTVVSFIMSKVPLMIATFPVLAISLTLLAPAILSISAAFAIFSQCNWGGVAKGIVALLGVVGVVTLVAGIMTIFPLMIATFPVLAISLDLLAPAILAISAAFMVFNSVEWGAVGKGIVTMLGLVGLMVAVGAVISIFPKLILGMAAFAVLLAVLSKLFGALDAVNMANLGEAFVVLCKKIADGAKILSDAGNKYKDGIAEISEAVKTAAKVATTNYAAAYMRAGQQLMRSLTDGVTSQKALFTAGVMTVTNSINDFLPGAKANAYNTGAIIGGSLIEGFRGPRGLDDPPEESKATKKGTKTMQNTIANAKSYLVPTAENTGGATGAALANQFSVNLSNGTDDALAEFNNKIAAAQERAEALRNTQQWVADHPNAIGKRVQKTKKNGSTDEWVKRGNLYYHYQNGNPTGVFSKKQAKKLGLKVKSKSKSNTPPIPYDTASSMPASTGGGGTSSGSGSGSKKGSSKKGSSSKKVEAALWGQKSGYAPNKKYNIWSWSNYFKGFNKYTDSGKSIDGHISKFNKSVDILNKYAKKITSNTDPKSWDISPYIKKTAKIVSGIDDTQTKSLKNDIKKRTSLRDKYLEKAAEYSDKADHAKNRKARAKYNKKSQEQINLANKEEEFIAKDTKTLKPIQNKYNKLGKIIGDTWAGIYGESDDYKEAKNNLSKYKKDATKQKAELRYIKSERKKAVKDEKKYAKSNTKNGKAKYEAAKKYISYLDKKANETENTLDKDTDKIKDLTKAIKNGPHEEFNKMFKDVSNNIKDALKWTSLFTKDSGENIWEHFTYNGTKKDFESGKQAWRYAGYGKTQNEHYANLKADRDYILAREDLSDELKDYVSKNWRDLGNEMHAFRYGSLADQKQIDLNYQQKVKNDHDSAYQNFKERVSSVKEWAANIRKLAELGFGGKALRDLINEGYSDENLALTDTLIDLLQNGTNEQKKEVLNLGKTIADNETDRIVADIMTSATYAAATPERQKELRECLGFTDDNKQAIADTAKDYGQNAFAAFIQGIDKTSLSKSVINSINAVENAVNTRLQGNDVAVSKTASNTIKSVSRVLNDASVKDAPEIGKYLIQGIISGVYDHDKRAELYTAIKQTGNIAPDTVKKILGITSDSYSTVFYDIGQSIQKGLAAGISGISDIGKAAQKSSRVMLSGFGAINQIGTENITPTVAPVVDQNSFDAVTTQINGFKTDTSAQLANQIQYQLDTNRAIQNFNTQVDYDDSNMIYEIQSMHSDMMKMQEAISQMRVTMDTGALVGQIAPRMDKTLGQRSSRGRRGR